MMRNTLVSAILLLVHLAAGVLACRALNWAFQFRVSLQVMLGPWLPMAVALMVIVVVLSLAESRRTYQQWRRSEGMLNAGLRVRGLFYMALAYLAVELFVFKTERDKFVWLGVLVTYTSYVTWTRMLPRLQQRIAPRIRRGFDLLCMNMLLTLMFAEAALRLTAVIWPIPLLVTSAASEQTRLAASRLTPGWMHCGFPVNSAGHYDQEFVPRSSNPEEQLVVSIGDSFSVSRVPHPFHFTTICEQALSDVAVYNMGISMIGPSEYLYLLQHEALALHPDLVLVNLFIGNDLTDGVFYQGPPRWHDAQRYLLPVVLQRLQKVGRERDHLEQLDRDSRASADSIQTTQLDQVRAALVARAPELADPLLEKPTFRQSLYLQIECNRAEAVCGTKDHDEFFRKLLELTRVSGIPLAFVLIPDEFQVEDPLWRKILEHTDQSLDRDRPQREIIRWLQRQGIDYLDLLPVLRSTTPLADGLRHVYHLQDSHFNVRGNDVAGRAIANFVRTKLAQDAALRKQFTKLPIQIQMDDATANRWMLSGWHHNQQATPGTGCWSHGLQSELLLPLPTDADVKMNFRCQPLTFPGAPEQTVSLILNGGKMALIPLRSGVHDYSVTLPRTKLREYQNHFVFEYSLVRRPSDVLPESSDERLVSVCWYSLSFGSQDAIVTQNPGGTETKSPQDDSAPLTQQK